MSHELQRAFNNTLSNSRLQRIEERRDTTPDGKIRHGKKITLCLEHDVHEEYFWSLNPVGMIHASEKAHGEFIRYIIENHDNLIDKSSLQWYAEKPDYTMTTVEVPDGVRRDFDNLREEVQEGEFAGVDDGVWMSAIVNNALKEWDEVFEC